MLRNNINIIKIFKQNRWPKNSIFGFRILNVYQSIIYSYLFIIIYLISFKFGSITEKELIAKSLYILISNLSFIILSFNIYFKRDKLKKLYYKVLAIPIIFFLPYAASCVFIHSSFLINYL